MRILHLTDTHLYGDDDSRHYGRIDTTAALNGLLARFTALRDIDAVVLTGDASEDAAAASYQKLHAILDPFAEQLGAQLAVVMGNHDVSAHYAEVRGMGARGTTVQDHVLDLPGGGRIVVLDSSVPGAGYGHLEAEQIQWLRDVLATPAAGDRGTVLAIHHPPLVAATAMLQSLDLDELEVLAGVLEDTDVRIVLAGHYHHEMTSRIGAVPVHVAPGITNVVDPITAGEREGSLALSGASIIELAGTADPAHDAAPRVFTSVFPNAGDPLADPTVPVYDFGPAEIRAIQEHAGR